MQSLPTTAITEHTQSVSEFLRHAEGWPITVGFFMLLVILAGLFTWLSLKAFPAWLQQQEANRAHATLEQDKRQAHQLAMLAAARMDAAADLKAAHELAETQHRHITGDVSGKVERVQEDVKSLRSDMSNVRNDVQNLAQKTHSIAAKLGVSILAILTLGGAGSTVVWVRAARHAAAVVAFTAVASRTKVADADDAKVRIKCDPACAVGQHCCGENKCCQNKSETATKQPDKAAKTKPAPASTKPSSAIGFASLRHFASGMCDSRKEVCL